MIYGFWKRAMLVGYWRMFAPITPGSIDMCLDCTISSVTRARHSEA